MKKHLFIIFILILSLCSLCVVGGCDFIDNLSKNLQKPHIHEYSSWQSDALSHWKVCSCGDKIEEGSHIETVSEGYGATCGVDGKTEGVHCSVCSRVIIAQEVIPATNEHTFVSVDYRAPSFTENGFSSGEECEICHKVLASEGVLLAYENTCSNYAYNSFAGISNGSKLQSFYKTLYDECVDYHTDNLRDGIKDGSTYIAFSIKYSNYNITSSECFKVLKAVQADCPLFYWISGAASANGTYLNVGTHAEYLDGDTRASINESIYSQILSISIKIDNVYDKVLYLHDKIVSSIDYAYKSDGVTPEDTSWAHNVVGFFVNKSGVCETYAETAQLYLNYWGIENVLTTGMAGGVGHAWNLIKLDDNNWYWFDFTWDDQPSMATGKIYNYFCKIDGNFDSRTLDVELYSYPSRATTDYIGNTVTVGSRFTVNKLVYEVMGYGEVELVGCTGIGKITVPSSVVYSGKSFSVVSVGNLDGNTLKPVFGDYITSVELPKTVRYIRGAAFSTTTITSVTIASDNEYLFVEGKAIYKKNPTVLICYLMSATSNQFSVKDGTVGIESGAILNNFYLQTVVIPDSVQFIDYQAIIYCSKFKYITYSGSETQWNLIDIENGAFPTCTITYLGSGVG